MIINRDKLVEFLKIIMEGTRDGALNALRFPMSGLNVKLQGGCTITLGIDKVPHG